MGHTEDFADGGGAYRRQTLPTDGNKSEKVLWTLLTDFNIQPRHTSTNQSSQRVCKDHFLVCSGHLRHWLPGTVAADFGLGGRVKDATDVLLASR